jgi:hypothetical protein
VAAVTADATVEIPPDWVPWHALLYWVLWIIRRDYQPEFDETAAKLLMPDVVLALRHDVDNRTEPRLGLYEHDRFIEEIDWLDKYVVENWSTGLVRRRVPRAGEPPAFTLAAHWDWLMNAVRQVAPQEHSPSRAKRGAPRRNAEAKPHHRLYSEVAAEIKRWLRENRNNRRGQGDLLIHLQGKAREESGLRKRATGQGRRVGPASMGCFLDKWPIEDWPSDSQLRRWIKKLWPASRPIK